MQNCTACGYPVDTPNHTLGCARGKSEQEAPTSELDELAQAIAYEWGQEGRWVPAGVDKLARDAARVALDWVNQPPPPAPTVGRTADGAPWYPPQA